MVICLPEVTPNDIWFFIYLRGKVRWTGLHNAFVKYGKKCAHQTFVNYLKELMRERKIAKDYDQHLDTIVYFVPATAQHLIKILIDNREFDEQIDKMTEEEAKETLKELIHGDVN